ncbi:uncharacterized protein LOC133815702 [Humulus lupulus]|uniref:uncharacterized protein LOC133815702 n=1 Tax=Humulus lupulus TaxID=3486 RepID=UPI002B407C73|nr:uncharacterized protein LOC133815702 [Humulus lupulus]
MDRSSQRMGEKLKLKLPEYTFFVPPQEVVSVMKGMGSTVRWPEKMKAPTDKWDRSKWCEFHSDHGHLTDECIALRLEVNELLKRGHLTNYLSEKGRLTIEGKKNREPRSQKSPTPDRPPTKKVVNCITGGSEVSGITYSAAKRHARSTTSGEVLHSTNTNIDPNLVISFTSTEATDLLNPHHDALVISINVANCLVKRVLIDNGSSTNILFLNALQGMGIDESNITRCSTMLVGFSGEHKSSIGEIDLPVYAEGVNICVKFLVLECPSAYNIILGRPWIHDMRAVPSTYHQIIRFPTKWGVQEIKGEQKTSRDCYRQALKPGKATL